MAYMSYVSPLAVFRPLKTPPYQLATPWILSFQLLAAGVGAFCGIEGSWSLSDIGVALDAGETADAVKAGLGRLASACTVRAEYKTTSATIATAETPATRQSHSGAFRLKLRVFLFITIRLFY
jgi:hypothetical protein